MKFSLIGILCLLISCGSDQKPKVVNIQKDIRTDCDSLKLTNNLVKIVFNDSTIVSLYSKVKELEIVVKHQEILSNKLNLEFNGKKFDFQKFEDNESVDGNIDYTKVPNLFLINGMCTKCDTSIINIASIYYGVGVELKVKKDKCSWRIIDKFIYDT